METFYLIRFTLFHSASDGKQNILDVKFIFDMSALLNYECTKFYYSVPLPINARLRRR
jgi:hypothetical protein